MKQFESDGNGREIAGDLYTIGHAAGTSDMIDTSGMSADDMAEISTLMNALAHLRHAETRLSEASRKYMKLNEQDMRALHYLIVAKRRDAIVTPGALAHHLRISAASTTKLLNRLERDGHIVRRLHPKDRRAIVVEITPETEISAKQSVGRQQARRVYAAARLTSDERATVTRFLEDMAQELSLDGVSWAEEPEA
ncbi:MarR family transcriptional regulator [Actinomycetaceae bacterium L2_0104]